jgi:aspartyl-tRNA(Asn)/glutamyl-tRNA(Gln) amidotransferase subunit C
MAKITLEDVDYVAGLAHLTLDAETREAMAKDLTNILGYIDHLDKLDTSDVEPMMHVLDVANVYREDVEGESLSPEDAFKNAPQTDGEFFLVPKILEAE